ncbi:MAG: four helix bundle protein [Myxococcales bacterium]
MFSFQKLDVYRRAVEFVALTQRIANEVPKGNAALLDQLRRAASSIPLNIAEATGRTGTADIARTYAIARGSAMECAALMDLLAVLEVIDPETKDRAAEILERVVAMLTRLCR